MRDLNKYVSRSINSCSILTNVAEVRLINCNSVDLWMAEEVL